MDIPAPSRTLYVRNLPDKLPKQRLRQLLHALFSAHGRVVWIVAEKTMKLRGQAFITFEQQTGATAALRALQSSNFLGRTVAVSYARQITDRANGVSFGGDSKDSQKIRAAKRKATKLEIEKKKQEAAEMQARAAASDGNSTGMQHADGSHLMNVDGTDAAMVTAPPMEIVMPPNNILFVEGLPKVLKKDGEDIAVSEVLQDLFARFSGFVEVRSVPGKDDIAFVEFSSDGDAAIAMAGLDKHPLGTPPQLLKVTFAKK